MTDRANKLGVHTLSANAVVRACIAEHIKEAATAVLAAMGLAASS